MTIILVVVGVLILALSGFLGDFIGKSLNPVVGAQSWLATRYQAVYDFLQFPAT